MTKVRFLVRLLSGHKIVLFAHAKDTIRSVLETIQSHGGLPTITTNTTCFVYRGKELRLEQTLLECGVDRDAALRLVARMESTPNPYTWHMIHNELVPLVLCYCDGLLGKGSQMNLVQSKVKQFVNLWMVDEYADGILEIFAASSALQALVRLYVSFPRNDQRSIIARDSISLLVDAINVKGIVLPDSTRKQWIHVVLELCKLLGMSVGSRDPLYRYCRDHLRVMVLEGEDLRKGLLGIQKIFPFAQELAFKMSRDCVFSSLGDPFLRGPTLGDMNDFTAVLAILKREIEGDHTFSGQIENPFNEQLSSLPVCHKEKIEYFRSVFRYLLNNFDTCLKKIEKHMDWRYLTILKQLNSFSKLYDGCKEIFRDTMARRKGAICNLICKYAKRSDDIEWIFDCKELIKFEAKKHLALMMLPELNNNVEPFRMLIKRSHLLAQSFEFIAHASPQSLRAGLSMGFRGEMATGSGVLREWFVLVCEEIFNPQNALFVACSKDRRRFLPNPASKVNPGHLQYFRFCGRVIALALTRGIHIGIGLHRTFVLQLAGDTIVLEDIRDVDPFLYNSWKHILEMDADVVDQDALGLTFVHEIEEFGIIKTVELCAGGKNVAVNSKNRIQYVESLIQQRFVISIGQQVEHFASGFADIASPGLQKSFFKCLDPEDLERMLRGREKSISVDDWEAHTDYHGFEKTDPRICWFWEAVGCMSQEQKTNLLCFWTSIRYLPVEGFGGLESRLNIHKSGEQPHRLPKSYSCFYQLCLPSYPSLSVTRERLSVVARKHVRFSFGTP